MNQVQVIKNMSITFVLLLFMLLFRAICNSLNSDDDTEASAKLHEVWLNNLIPKYYIKYLWSLVESFLSIEQVSNNLIKCKCHFGKNS